MKTIAMLFALFRLLLTASAVVPTPAVAQYTITAPTNGATVTEHAELDWTSSLADATLKWYVQISQDDPTFAQSSLIYDNPNIAGSARQAGANITNNHIYYLRLAYSLHGTVSAWSQVITVYSPYDVLSQPTLQSPASGTSGVATASVVLHWLSAYLAQSYDIQVSTSTSFTTIPLVVDQNTAGTSYTVNGLASGQTYYWKIRSKNRGGTSAWSTVWSFSTSGTTNQRQTNIAALNASLTKLTTINVPIAPGDFYTLWSAFGGDPAHGYNVDYPQSVSNSIAQGKSTLNPNVVDDVLIRGTMACDALARITNDDPFSKNISEQCHELALGLVGTVKSVVSLLQMRAVILNGVKGVTATTNLSIIDAQFNAAISALGVMEASVNSALQSNFANAGMRLDFARTLLKIRMGELGLDVLNTLASTAESYLTHQVESALWLGCSKGLLLDVGNGLQTAPTDGGTFSNASPKVNSVVGILSNECKGLEQRWAIYQLYAADLDWAAQVSVFTAMTVGKRLAYSIAMRITLPIYLEQCINNVSVVLLKLGYIQSTAWRFLYGNGGLREATSAVYYAFNANYVEPTTRTKGATPESGNLSGPQSGIIIMPDTSWAATDAAYMNDAIGALLSRDTALCAADEQRLLNSADAYVAGIASCERVLENINVAPGDTAQLQRVTAVLARADMLASRRNMCPYGIEGYLLSSSDSARASARTSAINELQGIMSDTRTFLASLTSLLGTSTLRSVAIIQSTVGAITSVGADSLHHIRVTLNLTNIGSRDVVHGTYVVQPFADSASVLIPVSDSLSLSGLKAGSSVTDTLLLYVRSTSGHFMLSATIATDSTVSNQTFNVGIPTPGVYSLEISASNGPNGPYRDTANVVCVPGIQTKAVSGHTPPMGFDGVRILVVGQADTLGDTYRRLFVPYLSLIDSACVIPLRLIKSNPGNDSTRLSFRFSGLDSTVRVTLCDRKTGRLYDLRSRGFRIAFSLPGTSSRDFLLVIGNGGLPVVFLPPWRMKSLAMKTTTNPITLKKDVPGLESIPFYDVDQVTRAYYEVGGIPLHGGAFVGTQRDTVVWIRGTPVVGDTIWLTQPGAHFVSVASANPVHLQDILVIAGGSTTPWSTSASRGLITRLGLGYSTYFYTADVMWPGEAYLVFTSAPIGLVMPSNYMTDSTLVPLPSAMPLLDTTEPIGLKMVLRNDSVESATKIAEAVASVGDHMKDSTWLIPAPYIAPGNGTGLITFTGSGTEYLVYNQSAVSPVNGRLRISSDLVGKPIRLELACSGGAGKHVFVAFHDGQKQWAVGTADGSNSLITTLSSSEVDFTITIVNAASVGEKEAQYGFTVYPNPGTDRVTVRWNDDTNIASVVELVDLLGVVVATAPIGTNGSATLLTGRLPNGTYIVRIGSGRQIQPLIIRH